MLNEVVGYLSKNEEAPIPVLLRFHYFKVVKPVRGNYIFK